MMLLSSSRLSNRLNSYNYLDERFDLIIVHGHDVLSLEYEEIDDKAGRDHRDRDC